MSGLRNKHTKAGMQPGWVKNTYELVDWELSLIIRLPSKLSTMPTERKDKITHTYGQDKIKNYTGQKQ